MASKLNKDKVKPKTHSQDSIPSFIRKTYDILEERKFPDIIDWNSEGTALVIKKPPEFCQKVLPAYFKHNNLTSFVRQLNMYNFHKRRTQNIDHVYYHELFQKGKKQLLKEIRRKNHDNALEKAQKTIDGAESSGGKDLSSLSYENQFLKRLYNDAMTKISLLETQIKDMTNQNQLLLAQSSQKNESGNPEEPISVKNEKPNELAQSQFLEISIPPLKLEGEGLIPCSNNWLSDKSSTVTNGSTFLKLKEESAYSTTTDHSYNSPNCYPTSENEKCFDLSATIQTPQFVQNTSQTCQYQATKSGYELFVSKKETSIGQNPCAWDAENPNELLRFDDHKLDKTFEKFQLLSSNSGKRPSEFENPNELEPRLKRNELCIFSQGNLISTGTEEKDILGTSLYRCSIGNEEYEQNPVLDLMDFNQSFYG